MRRFSQRSHLVTLTDINITPLLDLAFVLLIIFVITTPLLEQGLQLNLPKGGRADPSLRKEDVRTVEIGAQGQYMYGGRTMTLAQVEQALVREARTNPNLIVYLRADRDGRYDPVFQIQNICAELGIKVSQRSEPRSRSR